MTVSRTSSRREVPRCSPVLPEWWTRIVLSPRRLSRIGPELGRARPILLAGPRTIPGEPDGEPAVEGDEVSEGTPVAVISDGGAEAGGEDEAGSGSDDDQGDSSEADEDECGQADGHG